MSWIESGVVDEQGNLHAVLNTQLCQKAGYVRTFRHILSNALVPAGTLLPIAGTLLITSEWSQRTTLTTFALIPRRSRVLAAKLLAAVVVSPLPFLFALAISAAGVAATSSGVHSAWTLHPVVVGQSFVYLAANMVIGIAFGAALLASALRPPGPPGSSSRWPSACGASCGQRSHKAECSDDP